MSDDNTPYYEGSVSFTVMKGTPFENIFDAADGSATASDWYQTMQAKLCDGAKPVYNADIPDSVIARAWVDVCFRLIVA